MRNIIKKIIKIRRQGFVGERSDNMLSEFQLIWSRGCRLGTQNAHTTCLFFTFEKHRKTKIGGIRVLSDYHTQGETAEESIFYITMGVWQLTRNKYKFPMTTVELVLWEGQLSFWHHVIHDEPSPFRNSTFSIIFPSPWKKATCQNNWSAF